MLLRDVYPHKVNTTGRCILPLDRLKHLTHTRRGKYKSLFDGIGKSMTYPVEKKKKKKRGQKQTGEVENLKMGYNKRGYQEQSVNNNFPH